MALAPLIVAVALPASRVRSPFRTFALGLTTGCVYFAGTIYWVVTVMNTYGGLAVPVAAAVGALLVAYLSLYVALFAWLVRRAVMQFGIAGVWLAPVFWVAAEWGRSVIGGGFPWVLLGMSQATVLPVVQLASVTGVYGLSALTALVATAAAAVTLSQKRVHRVAALGVGILLAVVVAGGAWRVSRSALLTEGTAIRVGLVQGAVPQDQKYDPSLREAISQRYLDLSRQAISLGSELVLWPEASTPFYFEAEAPMAEPIRRLAAQTRTPILVGTDEYLVGQAGAPDQYFNAAALVGPDGRTAGRYRKMRLVPFGEYVPLKSLLFFVGPLIQAVSDFSAGSTPTVFDAGGKRFSVAICYESVYPDLARIFVAGGSQLLTTITNDAWFGRSSAPYQHFEQGALRGVEEGRFVVRAANTGISGAVDPYGRVLAATPLFVPASLAVDVRLLEYRTIYSRVGDVVAWVSVTMTAMWIVGGLRRRTARTR